MYYKYISYDQKNNTNRVVMNTGHSLTVITEDDYVNYPSATHPEAYGSSLPWDSEGLSIIWEYYEKSETIQQCFARDLPDLFQCNGKMYVKNECKVILRNRITWGSYENLKEISFDELLEILTIGPEKLPYKDENYGDLYEYTIKFINNILDDVNSKAYTSTREFANTAKIRTLHDFNRYCRMEGIDISKIDQDAIENIVLRRNEMEL